MQSRNGRPRQRQIERRHGGLPLFGAHGLRYSYYERVTGAIQ
jgi:hypothetical protein